MSIPKPEFVTAQLLVSVATILVIVHLLLVLAGLSIYLERKISAFMQDRLGPNRVGFGLGLPLIEKLTAGFGFWGLGQSLADGIKMMLKEDYMPKGADRILFRIAPGLAVIPALIGFAIIPWGGNVDVAAFTIPVLNWTIDAQTCSVGGANLNIGIIYLLAVSSLSIYAVALGSWASNNKFSFLGGLRASSQMISYEIPMGLSILMVLLITGSLLPFEMIKYQNINGWLIISQPLVAFLFFTCMLAECNRAPFDNAECEQELVGGYHTEYSSMSFGLFALSEYIHMAVGCAMFSIMFLGGYQVLPGVTIGWLDPSDMSIFGVLAKFAVLFGKMFTLVCFCIVIRWSLPRLRFDQVMAMAWQAIIPLALILVVANAVFVFNGWTALWQTLAMNAGVAVLVLLIQPLLPKAISNRKVPMAGSRFSPLADDASLLPLPAHAREDRPVESMAGMNI